MGNIEFNKTAHTEVKDIIRENVYGMDIDLSPTTTQFARILEADTGLKVTASTKDGLDYNTVAFDDAITFIFNCGGAND
jgi:hypothetical protein